MKLSEIYFTPRGAQEYLRKLAEIGLANSKDAYYAMRVYTIIWAQTENDLAKLNNEDLIIPHSAIPDELIWDLYRWVSSGEGKHGGLMPESLKWMTW